MIRVGAAWLAGVVCVGFWASPLAAQEDVPSFTADGDAEANQKILEVIQKPLPKSGLEFSATPLEEIVAYLRDEYEIEIQLDHQAMEELGIDASHPITVNLRNISLRAAIRLMLKELEMTYVISDGVLLLTTQEEADMKLIVCVYPVRDLIDPLYQPTKAEKKDVTPPELLPIIDTIITTITYDTWADNGSGAADIRGLRPGLLVISQTQAVHEQIRNTLAAIRRAKQFAEQNQPASDPATVGGEGGFGGSRAVGGFGGRGLGGEEGGFGRGFGGGRGGFGGGSPPQEKENGDDPFGE